MSISRFDLGWIGAFVAICGSLYYIRTIVWGNTRPHRITWGVWTLIGILGVESAYSGGAGSGVYVAGVFVLCQAIVFALSLGSSFGKPGGEWYDYPLGAVAVAAIIVWRSGYLTPTIAAVIAVSADSVGTWFTLREASRQPMTESLPAWMTDAAAAMLALAAVGHFSFAATAFPLYLVVANSLIAGVLLFRRYTSPPFANGVASANATTSGRLI